MKQIYNEEALKNIMLSERIDKQYNIIHFNIFVIIIIIIICLVIVNNNFGIEEIINIVFK